MTGIYNWGFLPNSDADDFDGKLRATLNGWRSNMVTIDSEIASGRGGHSNLAGRFNALVLGTAQFWASLTGASRTGTSEITINGVNMTATLPTGTPIRSSIGGASIQTGFVVSSSLDGSDTVVTVNYSVNASANQFEYGTLAAATLPGRMLSRRAADVVGLDAGEKFATGGESEPDCLPGGITAKIGGVAGRYFAIKGIPHGVTTRDETDTIFSMRQSSGVNSGNAIFAYSLAIDPLWVLTAAGSADTGTATTAHGQITFDMAKIDGAGVTTLGSSANLFAVRDNGNARILGKASGNLDCDGTVSSAAFDFAEYFESESGKAIPNGTPVVFVGETGLIRPAKQGEVPFGVISATACVIGNQGLAWHGEYLRDEFGAPLKDAAGNYQVNPDYVKPTPARILNPNHDPDNPGQSEQWIDNPDYDPATEFLSRAERPEWNVVGLMGQMFIPDGAPVAPNWIKMKQTSPGVSLWLVR